MKARFIHTLLLVAAIVSLTQSTFGQKLKFKTCNKPLPLQLKPFTNKPQRIDFLCGNTGCNKGAANDKQNAQKNNYCAPTDSVTPVTLQTFSQLNDASNNEPSIPKGEPPPSRAKLANIIKVGNRRRVGEGKTVAFVGVEGLIVVDTPDALLIASKERSEEVKDVVDRLRREEREELL